MDTMESIAACVVVACLFHGSFEVVGVSDCLLAEEIGLRFRPFSFVMYSCWISSQ